MGPTCCSIYLNDNEPNVLAYADDIVLISNSPENLQLLIDNVSKLFDTLGVPSVFQDLVPIDMSMARSKILAWVQSDWLNQVNSKPKLRSYKLFKRQFGAEEYLCNNLSRYKRSLLAQIRCGVLPLNIEVGRFRGQSLEQRTCPFCPDSVETEFHFIIKCSMYQDYREIMFNDLNFDPTFRVTYNDLDEQEQFCKLLSFYYKEATEFICKAWKRRQSHLFD